MKIALFGASGVVGSRIAAEALQRGHEVTAITRTGGTSLPGARVSTGDLGDAVTVKEAAATHDVIVSATGPSRTGESHQPWLEAVQNLIDHGADARVLFVGGRGR